MSDFTPEYIAHLQEELLRVVARGGIYGTFTVEDNPNYSGTQHGQKIEGATESDVIAHLTSRYSPVSGRVHRFPGISNGWVFDSAIKAAGFRFVTARNYRNQKCRVVTL